MYDPGRGTRLDKPKTMAAKMAAVRLLQPTFQIQIEGNLEVFQLT